MTRFGRRPCAALIALCGLGMGACKPPPPDHEEPEVQVERGRQLLARYHCGTCHSIPGVAASQGKFAASLEAYGRRSYIVGRVPNEPALLARWIVEPGAIVPGTLMPNMGVSHADGRDMAAYLGQLR